MGSVVLAYRTDDKDLPREQASAAMQQLRWVVSLGVAPVAPAQDRAARRTSDRWLLCEVGRRTQLLLPTERLQDCGDVAGKLLLGVRDVLVPALSARSRSASGASYGSS